MREEGYTLWKTFSSVLSGPQMHACGGPTALLRDSEVLGLGLGPHSEAGLPHWVVARSAQVCFLPKAAPWYPALRMELRASSLYQE